jgi:hypothetical protein
MKWTEKDSMLGVGKLGGEVTGGRRKVKKRPCQEHKSVCTNIEAFFEEKDSEDGSMKYRI